MAGVRESVYLFVPEKFEKEHLYQGKYRCVSVHLRVHNSVPHKPDQQNPDLKGLLGFQPSAPPFPSYLIASFSV